MPEMRPYCGGALLLALASVATLARAETELATTITGATVYSAGATLTREATLSLSAGAQTVTLIDLPADLSDAEVQIELADSRVRLGQIRRQAVAQARASDAEVRAAEDALHDATAALQAIEDGNASADLTLKFLDGLAQGYAKEAWTDSASASGNPENWRRAIEVLEQGSDRARKTKRDSVAAKRDAEALLRLRQRELNLLRGRRTTGSRLQVTLEAPVALNTTLRLHYFTEDAAWAPVYEARLDSTTGKIELAQRAIVSQETDEPWRAITLQLATGEPLAGLEVPELFSEFLVLEPEQSRADMNLLKRRVAAPAAAGQVIEEIVVTAAMKSPSPEIGAFAVTYPIPGTIDLDNDLDEDQLFDLSRETFDARLVTQVVPRESPQAFLSARFRYESTLPLQASEMKVFVDGTFAGSTFLEDALPGEELTLPMGLDRRVEVEVRNQGGRGGTSGLIGKRRTERTDYLFRLTNRRDQPTEMEVRDLLPVSRDRAIKVQPLRAVTPPTERDVDNEPGLLLWRQQVEPGATWEIRHGYSVEYPADRRLARE